MGMISVSVKANKAKENSFELKGNEKRKKSIISKIYVEDIRERHFMLKMVKIILLMIMPE